jgi:hypothetical protein
LILQHFESLGEPREGHVGALRRIAFAAFVPKAQGSLLVGIDQPGGPSPTRSASTAKCAANVVLPLPPFCEVMTIVFMKNAVPAECKTTFHENSKRNKSFSCSWPRDCAPVQHGCLHRAS